MKKVKEALKRFQAVVESLECECDGYHGYTCTIHSDRILAKAALVEIDAVQPAVEPDVESQCTYDHQAYIKRGWAYCPHCLDRFSRKEDK